ncbi:hypothetical protein L1887_50827 [Cichorium endivia]|nr:hypothetical protein L1887_50827 [Cichorium endivia]
MNASRCGLNVGWWGGVRTSLGLLRHAAVKKKSNLGVSSRSFSALAGRNGPVIVIGIRTARSRLHCSSALPRSHSRNFCPSFPRNGNTGDRTPDLRFSEPRTLRVLSRETSRDETQENTGGDAITRIRPPWMLERQGLVPKEALASTAANDIAGMVAQPVLDGCSLFRVGGSHSLLLIARHGSGRSTCSRRVRARCSAVRRHGQRRRRRHAGSTLPTADGRRRVRARCRLATP